MMATGSVRGKCSVLQAVHLRTWPPRPCSVGPPHRPQNRCRRCQSTWALLWARMPTSWGVSCAAAARASTKLQGSSRFSSWSGSESAETSTAKWAAPSMRPRKTGGPSRPNLSMSAGSTHPSSAFGAVPQQEVELHTAARKRERGSPGRLPEPVFIPALHVAPVQGIAGKNVCRHARISSVLQHPNRDLHVAGHLNYTRPQVRRNHHSAASSRTARVNRSGSFQERQAASRHDARCARPAPFSVQTPNSGRSVREPPVANMPWLRAATASSSSGLGRPSSFSSDGSATRKLAAALAQGFVGRRRLNLDAVGSFEARGELGPMLAGLLGGRGLQR